MTYTSATADTEEASSVYGIIVHVLSRDDSLDLETREPSSHAQKKARKSGK